MSQNKIVIFHHFDKCGGTTLQEYLKNYYAEDKACFLHHILDDNNPRYQTKQLTLQSKERILASHFVHDPFGVTFTLDNEKVARVAFFREPLSRLISHWHMICRWQDHEIVCQPITFSEIREVARSGFKNFLLAIKNQHPVVKNLNNFYANHLLYNNVSLRKIYYEFQQAPINCNEHIAACHAALEKFDCIGLIEDYDFSLLMLNAFLSIPPPIQLQKLNVHESSKYISEIDKEALDLAEDLLQIDKHIYQHATELYATQKERLLVNTGNKLNAQQIIQKNYERQLLNKAAVKNTTITMSEALAGAGWHAREKNGKKTSRWTGPGTTAYLDVMLNRKKPLSFTLKISTPLSIQIIENLSISVDNIQTPVTKQKSEDEFFIIGILPKNKNHTFTRFIINTGCVTNGTAKDDPRLLGIEVISLTIKPIVHQSNSIIKKCVIKINSLIHSP